MCHLQFTGVHSRWASLVLHAIGHQAGHDFFINVRQQENEAKLNRSNTYNINSQPVRISSSFREFPFPVVREAADDFYQPSAVTTLNQKCIDTQPNFSSSSSSPCSSSPLPCLLDHLFPSFLPSIPFSRYTTFYRPYLILPCSSSPLPCLL